jgi:hypothetical protein
MGIWWDSKFFSLNVDALERACSVSGDEDYGSIKPESFGLQQIFSIILQNVENDGQLAAKTSLQLRESCLIAPLLHTCFL